jgi:hypothetical protein
MVDPAKRPSECTLYIAYYLQKSEQPSEGQSLKFARIMACMMTLLQVIFAVGLSFYACK